MKQNIWLVLNFFSYLLLKNRLAAILFFHLYKNCIKVCCVTYCLLPSPLLLHFTLRLLRQQHTGTIPWLWLVLIILSRHTMAFLEMEIKSSSGRNASTSCSGIEEEASSPGSEQTTVFLSRWYI